MVMAATVPIQFRIPPELHARITEAAKLEGVSLNQWGNRNLDLVANPRGLNVGDRVRPGKTSTRHGVVTEVGRSPAGLGFVSIRYTDGQVRTYRSDQRTFGELIKESDPV